MKTKNVLYIILIMSMVLASVVYGQSPRLYYVSSDGVVHSTGYQFTTPLAANSCLQTNGSGTSIVASAGACGVIAGLTQGSVIFAGIGGVLSQDNANLFWDNTNKRLGIGNAVPSVPLDVTGSVIFESPGPHAIGGGANGSVGFIQTGTFTSTTLSSRGMQITPTLIPGTANGDIVGLFINPILQSFTSGTQTITAGLRVMPIFTSPAAATTEAAGVYLDGIAAVGGVTTNATVLKIAGSATGATNNRSLWVASGTTQLDDTVLAGVTSVFSGQPGWSLAPFADTRYIFCSSTTTNIGVRVVANNSSSATIDGVMCSDGATNKSLSIQPNGAMTTFGGVLSLNAPFTSGSAAGNIVMPNNSAIFGVNSVANGLIQMIQVDTSNNLWLQSSGTQNIRWGRPLVALGGGAGATLGTIGGSGPTAAAQNTWMQVVDSTGATFWVPAWK